MRRLIVSKGWAKCDDPEKWMHTDDLGKFKREVQKSEREKFKKRLKGIRDALAGNRADIISEYAKGVQAKGLRPEDHLYVKCINDGVNFLHALKRNGWTDRSARRIQVSEIIKRLDANRIPVSAKINVNLAKHTLGKTLKQSLDGLDTAETPKERLDHLKVIDSVGKVAGWFEDKAGDDGVKVDTSTSPQLSGNLLDVTPLREEASPDGPTTSDD